MAVELDDLDRGILGLLLRDARTPVSQISDQIGLSRPAVAERMEKLERAGILRGTTAVLDPTALGREVTAFVAARGPTMDAKQWKQFRDLMRNDDEILEVHTVAGDDCFYLKVRTDSLVSLNVLVNKLTHAPFHLATRTTIVLKTHCEKLGGIMLGEIEK
jgi:Lrp/AsnC family leucine-responsive transcriptional regulator